jgi:hypothetical protein
MPPRAKRSPFSVRRLSCGVVLQSWMPVISRADFPFDKYYLPPRSLLFLFEQSSWHLKVTLFKMSNIIASSIAIFLGCAATYCSADPLATTFSYARAAALSVLIYVPIQFMWTCFLYPFYFSPLRKLPQAPVRFPVLALDLHPDVHAEAWGMEKLLQYPQPSSNLRIHGYCAT